MVHYGLSIMMLHYLKYYKLMNSKDKCDENSNVRVEHDIHLTAPPTEQLKGTDQIKAK